MYIRCIARTNASQSHQTSQSAWQVEIRESSQNVTLNQLGELWYFTLVCPGIMCFWVIRTRNLPGKRNRCCHNVCLALNLPWNQTSFLCRKVVEEFHRYLSSWALDCFWRILGVLWWLRKLIRCQRMRLHPKCEDKPCASTEDFRQAICPSGVWFNIDVSQIACFFLEL